MPHFLRMCSIRMSPVNLLQWITLWIQQSDGIWGRFPGDRTHRSALWRPHGGRLTYHG